MTEIQGRHGLILENRSKLSLSGVTDVDSFNENSIALFTELGELTIRGRELHVNEMSVENGNVTIEGDITALIYGDKDSRRKLTPLGKLFK